MPARPHIARDVDLSIQRLVLVAGLGWSFNIRAWDMHAASW